jgi:quinol monooxygenase YgiN
MPTPNQRLTAEEEWTDHEPLKRRKNNERFVILSEQTGSGAFEYECREPWWCKTKPKWCDPSRVYIEAMHGCIRYAATDDSTLRGTKVWHEADQCIIVRPGTGVTTVC